MHDAPHDMRTRTTITLLAAALLLVGLAWRLREAASPPDALWRIVSTCFDQAPEDAAAASCACPALRRSCCDDTATPAADAVWAESTRFVAIRDMKACGCPAGFVAGLALPRARVTGIEDPSRPDGIWPFAWDVARARIADEREIGLAINPKVARTQNQMHVHLLRLKPGVRARLDDALAQDPPSWPDAGVVVLRLPGLDDVFGAVAARVGDAAMGAHGVLVARAPGGGFVALITDRSSPQAYTQNRCS